LSKSVWPLAHRPSMSRWRTHGTMSFEVGHAVLRFAGFSDLGAVRAFHPADHGNLPGPLD
jgi:hypothetical protein